MATVSRCRARSPIVLVLVGIASVQLGAGVAKSLFDEVSPTALVFLRLVTSSLVLLVWSPAPGCAGARRSDLLVLLGVRREPGR